MKLKVGVQLFSVMGELMQDYLQTLENVAKAGYKYVSAPLPRPLQPRKQTYWTGRQ